MPDDFDDFDDEKPAHTSDGEPRPNDAYDTASQELRQFIERFNTLEEDAARVRDDKKELMSEIKARGFDKKAFDATIKVLKLEEDRAKKEALQEVRSIASIYLKALDKEELEDLL